MANETFPEKEMLFGYHQETRRSLAEEQYPDWMENNRLTAADMARLRERASRLDHKPLVSILLEAENSEPKLLGRTLDSLFAQVYPEWELRAAGSRDALPRYSRLDGRVKADPYETLNDALEASEGEFALVVREGDALAPDALFEAARTLHANPGADVIYADSDSMDDEGRRFDPLFKPGYSPDFLLAGDYVSGPCFFRRELAEKVGGLRGEFGGSEVYDLLLRLTEETGEARHIPKVLYHRKVSRADRGSERRAISEAMGRRGMRGFVEDGMAPGKFRARVEVEGEPKVSIIIPTRDNHALLKRCVESIERVSSYGNYEILIVDNDSEDGATLGYLARTPHRVVPFRGAFNYSRINNLAVSEAGGEYIILLNDDTEVVSGGWIEAMLGHAQNRRTGAVGARLLYPDGRVQHAGVVVGTGSPWLPGVATPSHQYFSADSPGYMGLATTTCNYSAVTAACMMVRKSLFEEVGGFDEENLKVNFNDVDLCLRLRERGLFNVYTPYAELLHYESASRGYKNAPHEALYIRERWAEVIDDDPYYNPNLSLGEADFSLRADMLRPKSLRRGGDVDTVNPWTMDERDIRKYVVKMWEHARSSRKTTLASKKAASEDPLLLRTKRKGKAVRNRLRKSLRSARAKVEASGTGHIRPDQFVWILGHSRTGSTWLGRIIAEQPEQSLWFEPYVGHLFGSFYQKSRAQYDREQFILADVHKNEWSGAIRDFIIKGAEARFPMLGSSERLFVKEPNGSIGAPLVMGAMPESAMVFLIRDPRDVISSSLDAGAREGWNNQKWDLGTPEKMHAATKRISNKYAQTVSLVNDAYKAHPGKKTVVRYEDLREDTFGVMSRMYEELGVPVDEDKLKESIERHSWENIPKENKGSGKFFRKGTSGGWKEDLSPEQIRIIERKTAPIIAEFYG